MGDVISEGQRLIENWLRSREEVARLKQQINRAECDEMNDQTALGKWLAPSDMKEGEKIGVWNGDSLFQVEKKPDQNLCVTIRTRGKSFGDYQLRRAS